MDGIGSGPVLRRGQFRALVACAVIVCGCAGATPASAALIEQAKLTSTIVGFGRSVAISAAGDTALVGDGGTAFVYERTGTAWAEQTALTPPTGTQVGGSDFGYSVALSSDGNTALVGGEDDNSNLGAVWVFVRSGTGWSFQQKLVGPTSGSGKESSSGEFGQAVALSDNGDTALIGGPGNSGNVGAAWIYTRSGAAWTEAQKIIPALGEETGDGQFGSSVALAGDGGTALVSAPMDDDGVGAAWTFAPFEGTWQEDSALKAPTTGPDKMIGTQPLYGDSVALSDAGTEALVGGPGDGGTGFVRPGAAWTYTVSGGAAEEQAKLTVPTSGANGAIGEPLFGSSVSLSGDGRTALIGGPLDDLGEDVEGVGAAWIATNTGSSWSVTPKLLAPTSGPGAEIGDANFGVRVALAADAVTAVIGGTNDGSTSSNGVGAAWVFANPPSISNVSPPSGPAGGGTAVTITGIRFTNAIGVSFGGVPASSFSVVSDTQIDAVAPPGPAAPVDVTVTTPEGTSATELADRFTYFPSAPGAPSDVHAVAANASATVSFAAASPDGSGITSYRVLASPGGASASGGDSPIRISGLRNGTRYTFTITATNGLGTGPPSAASNAVVPEPPPPTVSHVSISRVAKRRPALSFRLTAGPGGRPLSAVAIAPPHGLSFSKSHTHGVTVDGANGKRAKWTAKLSRGVLTITLKSPQSKLSVAIDSPALTVSGSLASKVKRHKVSKVTFTFTVTDSAHVKTKLSSKDRIS
jgi:hypothetical protein